MKKRLLAMLLAVLLIGTMPVRYAAGNEPASGGITLKYDISGFMRANGFKANADTKLLTDMSFDSTKGLYRFVGAKNTSTGASITTDDSTNDIYYRSSGTEYNYSMRLGRNVIIAFEVYVPVSGTYKMRVNYDRVGSGDKIVFVYHNTAAMSDWTDVSASADALYKSGKAAAAGPAMVKTDKNGTADKTWELTAGYHTFTFKTDSSECDLASFELISGDGAGVALVGERITSDKTEISADGGSARVQASAYLSNWESMSTNSSSEETAYYKAASFTYSSSDNSVAEVDADTGAVTAVSEGTVTITATCTDDGVVNKTLSTDITVTAAPAAEPGTKIAVKYDISAFMRENKFTWGSGKYLTDMSFASTKGFYEFAGAKYGSTDITYECSSTYGSNAIRYRSDGKTYPYHIRLQNNAIIAFEVYVPVSGTYMMRMYNDTFDEGLTKKTWVYHTTGIMSDAPTDAVEAHYNSMSAGPTVVKEGKSGTADKTWELEQGYHIFTFRSDSNYTSLASFELYTGESEETALMAPSVKSEKDTLVVGETTALAASVYMSDESAAEGAAITFESLTPDKASVDADGVVKALSAGTAGIKVTARQGEYETEAVYTVKIEPANASGYVIGYGMTNGIENVVSVRDIDFDKTNNFWGYHSDNASETAINLDPASGIAAQLGETQYIAIKLNIPASGEYLMSLSGSGNGEGDVWLLPGDTADIAAAIEEIDPTGKVNYAADSEAGVVNIEAAGEYIAVFKGSAIGIKEIILDGGNGLALMDADVCIENKKAFVSGILSDGSRSDLADADVTFSTSDRSIVSITANGVISENNLGTATITADITLGEVTLTRTAEYEVITEPVPYSGVDTVIDFLSVSSEWTSANAVAAGFSDSVRDEDVRGITYKYTGTGKQEGNWEYRGVGDASGWGTWVPATSGVFSYHTSPASATNNLRLFITSANRYVAFNVKIPAAGKYLPEFEYTVDYSDSAKLDMFIIPMQDNEKIYSALDDEAYLGTVDFYEENVPDKEIRFTTLNNIEFDSAGEYILVFKQPAVTSGRYARPRRLYLNGINCLRDVELTASSVSLTYGEEAQLNLQATLLDGAVIPSGQYTVEFDSSAPEIVSVDKNGKLTGKGDGEAVITVTVSDGVNEVRKSVTIKAVDNTGVADTVLTAPGSIYVRGSEKLDWRVVMNSKNVIKVPADTISYSYSEEGIVSVDETARVTGIAEGTVTVTLSAVFRGMAITDEVTINVSVSDAKSEPSYYTYERRANALANISKYSWAKSEQKSAISRADKYLTNYEVLYDRIPGEGIPRSLYIGYYNDPEYRNCKYCGVDVVSKYGDTSGGWSVDILARPWKIQCPDCKRVFPSNDFENFYELGRDKQGYFDLETAYKNHRELFADEYAAAGSEQGYGYLKNTMYPELDDAYGKKGLRAGETVEGWGVDDGFGYVPKDENGQPFIYKNGETEAHVYIGYYMNSAMGQITTAIQNLGTAYMYTDDIKYGRAGAILLDRLADVYPSFDATMYNKKYPLACGGSGRGHIYGRISDATQSTKVVHACDMLFPALTDSEVIEFLEEKAAKYELDNPKSSALEIWDNWDKNILDHIFSLVQVGKIKGNYGLYHETIASAAIVKDHEPETSEMIEWLYAKDDESTDERLHLEGGDFSSRMIDVVDRDGMGNEASPAYNGMWLGRLGGMADMLSYYKGEKSYNMYEHPKFVAMHMAFIPIMLANTRTANIGDQSGTASLEIMCKSSAYINAFKKVEDPELKKRMAEFLYVYNNYDVSDLRYDIFDEDPDSLNREILELTGGKAPVQTSEMMTGYGFAVLRAGMDYRSASDTTSNNNQRDFYIYFGRNSGHGHDDILSLGMDAYGVNVAPDLGYPQETGTQPERLQWVSKSISHNTVTVDEASHSDHGIHGYPLHFDDSGKVKVMDISAPNSYEQVDEFRRTLVMVEVDDDVSYGVDFFRIIGGDKHTYSFHSQAEHAYGKEGLDFATEWDADGNYVTGAQVDKETGEYVGSYADINWPAGEDPNSPELWTYETVYPVGYSWLGNVRRDSSPEKKFSVEFDVEDYRNATRNGDSIVLRVTQLNDFEADEVTLASGPVPNRSENRMMPKTLDYMLVQREGENLDSLFTTVFEPYMGQRYLKDMSAAVVTEVTPGTSGKSEKAYAVKVEHESGKVDYIVYATDNTATYNIDGVFDFRGNIGVYSLNKENVVVYRYVNDGDIIGEATEQPGEYTGTIADFERGLTFENYIDVKFDGEVDITALTDKYIYVDNDEVENGAYRILSASALDNGNVRLNTGLVSVIRAHRDPQDPDRGYVYNIKPDQSFTIPLGFEDSKLPTFKELENEYSVSAENSVEIDVDADSPVENMKITYVGTSLPRGASVNADTGVVTWKPDGSQIGDNHFAVTARDADGRENTVHFTITVYGSTTSKPSTGNTGTGTSGGGGGGASGQGTTDTTPDGSASEDEKDNADNSSTDVGRDDPGAPSSTVRFIDLGDHSWAADSINALADDGIIKGTSESTYSPANNITRADYALLLVRAFNLTSDDTTNFDDVLSSDYFAAELAIARNTGIVNGIGDNKYAPRSTITRQDMMVITYRALEKLGKLGDTERNDTQVVPYASEYADYGDVADYAKPAVSYLISNGIVNGKNGLIAPNDYTTRAEVAVLLGRILDYVK